MDVEKPKTMNEGNNIEKPGNEPASVQRLVMPLPLSLSDASPSSAPQNSRNNLPAPTKAPSNPFSCASALHIAHIPDWAKEKAILELLANDGNKLDAVVQCGTNMSLIDVSEKLEPVVGIPILGINAVTFWYALRENGFEGALVGAGRLLREF